MTQFDENYPLVSIITPSYNSYPYIIENIESVKNQNYPNREHIIIDGGSTDGTVEVLRRYPHLIWISEKDNGQSNAINKGFNMAKGEVIGWLNSDDCYNQGAVSFAVKILTENNDIDLVCSDEQIINEKGEVKKILKGEEVSFEKILFKNIVRQPTIFMKRKVVETLSGVNEDLHYAMDRDLWLRALIYGFKFQYCPNEILAKFRYCKGTKSKEMPISFFNEWIGILDGLKNQYKNDFRKKNLIENACKFAQSSLLFVETVKYFHSGHNLPALKCFFKAMCVDKKNFFRIKVWKLLIREIYIKMHLRKNSEFAVK